MAKRGWIDTAKQAAVIFAGCICIAAAYNLAYDPNGMVTGGVSGLGIIIRRYTEKRIPGGIPLWMSQIFLNIPIYLAALLIRGRRFVLSSVVGTLMMTLALAIIPTVDIVRGDPLLASIFGAVCSGFGSGLVLSCAASTGGTDMLGMSLSRLMPGINVANLIAMIDGAVVVIGAFAFGIPSAMYAVLSVFLASRVTDFVLTGLRDARMFLIISDQTQSIADEIMQQIEHGVTGIRIEGMYTRAERCMLMCIVYRREIVSVKRIIRSHDPHAFVVISDVRDVRGEGFIEDILEN